MPAEPPAAPSDRLSAAHAHVEAEVRAHDRDRWLAALYAPADRRPPLHALAAFAGEIDRIRDVVSDPLPGEIRARWWADMLTGRRGDEGEAHPVACALSDAIRRFRLDPAAFERLIEAKIFDLYDDPMPDVATLEAYCRDTFAVEIELAAQILAGTTEAATREAAASAGLALGITALLRRLPFHASRGQIFLPLDRLAAHGASAEEILGGRSSAGLRTALAELRGMARDALAETRRRIGGITPAAAPAFLPVALVEPQLARMEAADYEPFRTVVDLPSWRRQWCLWRAARRARRAAA